MTYIIGIFGLALCIALIIIFIHACFWDGMIFSPLVNRYLCKLPVYIRKPLYECSICMSPWWSALLLAFLQWHGYPLDFDEWLLIEFSVGGINTLFMGVIGKAHIANDMNYLKTKSK